MNIVKEKDYLEVRTVALIADYDKDLLANLYQPIIGFEAFALYLNLVTEAKNQRNYSVFTHEQIFNRMHITASRFVDARKALEAIGLLKTYLYKTDGLTLYKYEVSAPKSPKKFFDNALLYGMLINALGEKDALKLRNIYSFESEKDKGEDVTSSFKDVYQPNLNDPAFQKALKASPYVVGHTSGKINSKFSYEQFFEELSRISDIKEKDLSHNDMKEIERLATLYGANEVITAEAINSCYNKEAKKGERIDYAKFTSLLEKENNFQFLNNKKIENKNIQLTGESDLANKINIMESVSPKDYLVLLQNGTNAAPSDLKLINDLSITYKLSNAVICAVIDFVLYTNDNILSRPYCEKIAASLNREKIETAVDAMNYLKKVSTKKYSSSKKEAKKVTHVETVKEYLNDDIPDSTTSWNELILDMEDNEDNGKA